MRVLIVLAEPIGAGKSTVANLLGRRLAEAGSTAAVVDLDDVAFMQRDIAPHKLWRRGSIASAALVRGWFDAGTEAVVAHGPFFESGGYDLLLEVQPSDVAVRHVLLRVPVQVALARVARDDRRGASKNPDFLRATHERFAGLEALLPRPDFVFQTETLGAEAIADAIVAGLWPA